MLEKIAEYFEDKYNETKRAIDREYDWMNPREFVDKGIEDCLAVAMFSQSLGVHFSDIEPLYNKYKDKMKKLLEGDN